MYDFTYHRATSPDEAARLLGDDPDALALAGGQSLIPLLKQRLARPSLLVDLGGLSELREVRDDATALHIGALASHATVSQHPAVAARLPALARLAAGIGDPAVRNRGTLGGSIALNDPAADYPAALLALGARVTTTRREIAADDFFHGLMETALEPGELVTGVSFPVPARAAYAKFPNPASRYALVGVFVAEGPAGTRLAVSGAASCAFRLGEFEAVLAADFSPKALEGLSGPAEGLNSDLHAAADYRAHLVGVMARRALAAACAGPGS